MTCVWQEKKGCTSFPVILSVKDNAIFVFYIVSCQQMTRHVLGSGPCSAYMTGVRGNSIYGISIIMGMLRQQHGHNRHVVNEFFAMPAMLLPPVREEQSLLLNLSRDEGVRPWVQSELSRPSVRARSESNRWSSRVPLPRLPGGAIRSLSWR